MKIALNRIETTCYVCSGQNFKCLPFGYRFKGRDLRGIKCERCGLIFIHPQPSPDEVRSLYDEAYFTSQDLHLRPHGRGDYFSSVEGKKETKTYENRLKTISKYIQPGKLLEIGCGPGHFLYFAQKAGWEVTGIEISEFASKHAREEFKLNVITGTLDSVALPEHDFNVVFMGDLLEHVTNPKAVLQKIGSLIAVNGFVYIEVPAMMNGLYSRVGSLLLEILKKTKYINLPPYHLFEFTPSNCRSLLKLSNYNLLYARQSVVSPKDIGLRDSLLTNRVKFTIQSMNYLITKLTGQIGDRITLIARSKT